MSNNTTNNRTHIDVGTSRLGYRLSGHGPDVLFVHGWPLHGETWREVVTRMPDHSCHVIDLPGSGRSITPADTEVSLRNHVEAIVATVDRLGLDDVVLVGHDTGGLIARFATARLGDRVSALIVTGSEIPYHHPAIINRLQAAARLPGATRIVGRLVNTPWIARSNQLLGGCFANRDLLEGSFRTDVLDPTFHDPAAVRRQLEVLGSYTTELVDELADVHPKITCPTLLVWGADDPYFPMGKAAAMTDQFGGPTRFEVIEDARLLVHEEHPERFAALCVDFLA